MELTGPLRDVNAPLVDKVHRESAARHRNLSELDVAPARLHVPTVFQTDGTMRGGTMKKSRLVLAFAGILAVTSLSAISTAADTLVTAESARVRAGTIEGTGRGRYRVNLDEGGVDNAYRSAVRAARESGRRAPSAREFRNRVNREIRDAVRQRYPRGVPAGASASIVIIVVGDTIIIIIN